MITKTFVEKAEAIATAIAQELHLDFSLQSLETVDSMLHDARHWKKWDKDNLVERLGCYVGKVLIGETGGQWCDEAQNARSLDASWVEVPSGIRVNPFVRCQKRIENGESDGVAVWAKVLVVTARQPAGKPASEMEEVSS